MIHLVYVSSAPHLLTEEELIQLLDQSRRRNQRLDITGMLLYAGGNFMQVLEGEEEHVEAVYQSILADDRNHGNVIIQQGPIEMRDFPQWSMGFRLLDSQKRDRLPGYTSFLDRPWSQDTVMNDADDIIALLYSFKKMI